MIFVCIVIFPNYKYNEYLLIDIVNEEKYEFIIFKF